jgi:hypothetical protein
MPEVPMCVVCRKPIDPKNDTYLIINKDLVKHENQWQYAHAECQRKGGQPATT